MAVRIEFSTDSAAFEDYYEGETARILRGIAERVESGQLTGTIRDASGNTVGLYDASA